MKHAALLTLMVAGLLSSVAGAQTVGLSGMLGGKALIIVDGGAPKAVAPGDSHKGVKIVSTQGDHAMVEIEGQRHTLRVGEARPALVLLPAALRPAATALCWLRVAEVTFLHWARSTENPPKWWWTPAQPRLP